MINSIKTFVGFTKLKNGLSELGGEDALSIYTTSQGKMETYTTSGISSHIQLEP